MKKKRTEKKATAHGRKAVVPLETQFAEVAVIIRSFKNLIVEFGRDFAFIGEEYRLQVGMNDFFLDLLFYNRELQCFVALDIDDTIGPAKSFGCGLLLIKPLK
jgi:hypothetical protein